MITGLNYMNASPSTWALNRFSQNNLAVSIRLYWDQIERTRGNYTLSGYQSLLQALNTRDIPTNVTFWNQLQSGAELPSWYRGLGPWAITINRSAHDDWLKMVSWVLSQIQGYKCIDSISKFNEPYWNTTGQRDGWMQLFKEMKDILRSYSWTILNRFTLSYTPGSGRYPDSVYEDDDVFGVTTYLDSNRTSYTRYNAKWQDWLNTLADCRSRGIPIWVIEFGDDSSDEHNRIHYENNLRHFAEQGVERAYGWAWHNGSEPFNLRSGSGFTPAYNELVRFNDTTTPPPPPPPPPPDDNGNGEPPPIPPIEPVQTIWKDFLTPTMIAPLRTLRNKLIPPNIHKRLHPLI